MQVRTLVALLVSFTLLSSGGVFAQEEIAPAMDAKTAVAYAHAAETDPLTPSARLDRKAAMAYIENDHNTHVLLCQAVFREMSGNRASNSNEITLQYMISTAAFLYEHPEAASDSKEQNLAGVNAALDVYAKFLAQDPGTKFKFLDGLEKHRAKKDLEKEIGGQCK